MINIRPVSDLRNKYPEIEELVLKEDEAVYLTKNGYGSMVVMSIEKYSNLMKEIDMQRGLEERFGYVDIEKELEESEIEAADPNTKYFTHEEVMKSTRRIIDGEEPVYD